MSAEWIPMNAVPAERSPMTAHERMDERPHRGPCPFVKACPFSRKETAYD